MVWLATLSAYLGCSWLLVVGLKKILTLFSWMVVIKKNPKAFSKL